MKIFLSSVSAQFKACRDALASDLRAIGCEVKVQEDFQQGSGSLIAQLENYVAQCDRVIALVGDAYGADSASDAIPPGKPPRSYTQWEYFFAVGERLGGPNVAPKDLFVYVASAEYLNGHPVVQSNIESERQQQFVALIKQSGKHRANFEGLDHLCRLVLRDGWQMNDRPVVVKLPFQLPRRALAGKLFGRQALVKQLAERLRNRENTDIWGPAGMGKTAVAAEAIFQIVDNNPANLAASPYPDGIVLLDLYSLKFESPDPAWHHLANSFDELIPTTQSAQDRAIQACCSRSALVIVEGAEEAKDGDRLQQLLSVLPAETVRLVLTRNKAQASSAKPLSVEAELERDEALALMREIWENQRDESVIAAVYDRFGGHPLALTWAASQLNAGEESPKAFLAGLDAETLPRINQPGYENHSLFWLFNRTVKHLTPDAKRILAAAGMLAQLPFPLGVAQAVMPGADERTARAAMKELVRYGLLRIIYPSNEQWELTHALTHQFAHAARDTAHLAPLSDWAIRAFDEAFEVAKLSRDFAALVQALAHSRALLAADRDTQLLGSLASVLRLKVSSFLMGLGRDDLMQIATSAGHAWLESANAEKLSSPTFQLELSQSYINLGYIADSVGDKDGARKACENSHHIRKRLAESDPENRLWQWELSESHEKLGNLAFAEDNEVDFAGHLGMAFYIRFKLARSDPNNWDWQFGLWKCNKQIADLLLMRGERVQAREHYQKCMSEAGHGMATDPDQVRWLFAAVETNRKLGEMEESDGNMRGAAAIYRTNVILTKQWVIAHPNLGGFLNPLLTSLLQLGTVTSKLGIHAEALATLQEALEIGEQQAKLDPGNVMFQDSLVAVKEAISSISK